VKIDPHLTTLEQKYLIGRHENVLLNDASHFLSVSLSVSFFPSVCLSISHASTLKVVKGLNLGQISWSCKKYIMNVKKQVR